MVIKEQEPYWSNYSYVANGGYVNKYEIKPIKEKELYLVSISNLEV